MSPPANDARRIFVAGATGYIGRRVTHELVRRGHDVVAFARPRAGIGGREDPETTQRRLPGARVRFGDVRDPDSLARDGFRGEPFDAAISCLASRHGGPADAWRIDYGATRNVLEAARESGVHQFVLLSAICVQRPLLEFQRAKLAMEQELAASGLTWSIVRPTAFFKSVAGQVPRVRDGKPYVMFGRGDGPAAKPIGEADLADFMADCLVDPAKQDAVLPIGGPGPAMTMRERGELLFELTGRRPRFRHVPIGLFDTMIPALGAAARVFPRLADKAEFARIGRYYATESMLLWDEARGAYDAEATPSHGTETLRGFYQRVLARGMAGQELGDQAIF